MLYEQKVITLLERVYMVNMKVKVTLSCPTLCNPMTIQSMEFSRSEFSRGSSHPRDQTQVSRTAGRFFTS